MSPSEAKAIWKSFGATDKDISDPDLRKKFFRKKSTEFHPDVNKNEASGQKFKELSAANDILKYASFYSSDEELGVPPWQTDVGSSYSKITKNDCTDINFFKKNMWELSNHSRMRYHVMAYDGAFFRSSLTVFGSEDIYEDMAKGMIVWNSYGANPYKTRAVFVHKENDFEWEGIVKLIYLDNDFSYSRDPVPLEILSNVPYNDQYFMRHLPDTLNDIAKNRK